MNAIHFPRISSVLIFSIGFLFLAACEEDRQFSEQEPYSVMVQRYRTYPEAQQTLERVKERGLNAYIIHNNSEEEGTWFSIMISAANDLEPMMEKKIQYEDNYGLKELQIVNYNKIKESLLPISSEQNKSALTTALRPDVSSDLFDLFKLFPSSSYYRPVAVQLFHSSDSFPIYNLSALQKVTADLPRGISQTSLLKNAKGIMEAIYEDDLSYQRLTLQVISLKDDHVFGDSIEYYFSKKVLDTREYEVEEMLPTEISNALELKGYMVNITPRPNQLKRYLIMIDSRKENIFFLQSETNSEAAMNSFMRLVGEGKGLTDYASFHNTFYTLPASMPETDALVYYNLELERELEGNTALLREGQYQAKFVMHTQDRGVWEISLMTTDGMTSSQRLFNTLYRNRKNIQKDSIRIFGQHGWLTTSRRRHPADRKYANMANEIQFATDKFIGVFSNKNRAWLTQEELLERARAGQFIVRFKELEEESIFSVLEN